MSRPKAILLAALLIPAAWFAVTWIAKPPVSAARLLFVGPYSRDSVVFSAAITNESRHDFVLDGIVFEYEDRQGHADCIYGFSDWRHDLKPGESTMTSACIPADSYKVRASTIDSRPSPLQRCVGRVAAWVHVARYPKFEAWLRRNDLLENHGSVHKHPGAWMVNPGASANDSIARTAP